MAYNSAQSGDDISVTGGDPWYIDNCYQDILRFQALNMHRMGRLRQGAAICDVIKLVTITVLLSCAVQYASLALTAAILCYSQEDQWLACNLEECKLLVEYEVLSSLVTAIFAWVVDCCNEIFVVQKYSMIAVLSLKSLPSFLTIKVGVVLNLACVFNGPESLGGIPFQPMAILLPTVLRRWCVTSQTQDLGISAQALKI